MATAEPIRCKKQLKSLAYYWLERENLRNYTLIVLGAHTALRISDLLKLTWADVYDATRCNFRSHIVLTETKTGKRKKIALHTQVIDALKLYFPHRRCDFIFANNRKNGGAIGRTQAWRIIKIAANATETNATCVNSTISTHSLRKTFGYFAWKSGVDHILIMGIYNHTSFQITRRYLGITQDDLDKIYWGACLF